MKSGLIQMVKAQRFDSRFARMPSHPYKRDKFSYFILHYPVIFFLFSVPHFSYFSSYSQPATKYKNYSQHFSRGLRYGLFIPDNYEKAKSYPLIVYLHGSRDTVSRDNYWYKPEIQQQHPVFVLTPKCDDPNQGWGNTWNPDHSMATKKTLYLMDSLIGKYNIDKSRLYIYGISMGGFGVFSVLAKESGKFAAAYAICGGSNPDAADKLKSTPLWIFHGSEDDIVPVYLSRDVYKEILAKGGKTVRYTEYPGVKHNSWENANEEKTLPAWLLTQQKGKTLSHPKPIANLVTKKENNTTVLSWTNTDKNIWYYKVFKNNDLIAVVDGDTTTYKDINTQPGTYGIIAVNYYFKESTLK